ncbi:hypothetical protein [Brasilonema bromeliae]
MQPLLLNKQSPKIYSKTSCYNQDTDEISRRSSVISKQADETANW